MDQHPLWYLNLVANPDVDVQIGSAMRPMRAHTADERRARRTTGRGWWRCTATTTTIRRVRAHDSGRRAVAALSGITRLDRERAGASRPHHDRLTATMIKPTQRPIQSPSTPVAAREAEQPADRQAEEPVADEVGDHRGAGVAGAAEHAGQHDLGAVEELEGRRDQQQDDAGRDHARVAGEEPRMVSGTSRKASAVADMKPMPSPSAVQPARRAPGASRRPIAWPTRTAAADESPSGTMKVKAAELSAIWCAASTAGSKRPAMRRHHGEHADLGGDLQRGRESESDERRETRAKSGASATRPRPVGWRRSRRTT